MAEYFKTMREFVGHAPLLLVAAGVIIYKDGKILLQQRTDNGNWGLHGGYLNLGETTEETVRRETREELGIELSRMTLFDVQSGESMHFTYPNGDEVYLISIIYLCTDFSGEITMDSSEVKHVQWFSVDQLPENINSPVDTTILKKFIASLNQ